MRLASLRNKITQISSHKKKFETSILKFYLPDENDATSCSEAEAEGSAPAREGSTTLDEKRQRVKKPRRQISEDVARQRINQVINYLSID